MTPPENFYPASHLTDTDIQRETYAGVQVLLERTADLPEIRKQVISHETTLKWYRWGVRGALAAAGTFILAKFGVHLPK